MHFPKMVRTYILISFKQLVCINFNISLCKQFLEQILSQLSNVFLLYREVLCLELTYLRIITGCEDGKLRIWNMLSGDCLRVMRGNSRSDPIEDICPCGERLVVHRGQKLWCVCGGGRTTTCWWDVPVCHEGKEHIWSHRGYLSMWREVSSPRRSKAMVWRRGDNNNMLMGAACVSWWETTDLIPHWRISVSGIIALVQRITVWITPVSFGWVSYFESYLLKFP